MAHHEKIDFFISRAGADKDVAVRVANILKQANYSTILQDHDFGHASFMGRMAQAWSSGARVVCLLSRTYQSSDYCKKEYQVPLASDPLNLKERVIVFRIEECAPIEHLTDLSYTDLVPLLSDAENFARAVRAAVAPQSNEEADFGALYRRSPKQILHPVVRPVPGFAGRDDELEGLAAVLWNKSGRAAITNSTAAAAAVKGLGGIGKSVLAQEYAWRNRGRYRGIWWVRAEANETLLDDLIALGSRFIAALSDVPDRLQAAQMTLDHIGQMGAAQPWLIVYDNVEKPGDIERLTPADGAHVLITTRWSDFYGLAEEFPVGVFSRDVAREFLLARARQPDAEAASRLAADLGHLPLALAHARSYCWGMHWSFDQYRAKLPELIKKAPREAHYPVAVFATFDLALEKAIAQQPEAEMLLGLLAFYAPERVPLSIVENELSDIERGEAVAALGEVSLIELGADEDGQPIVSLHRLVQEVMRARLAAADLMEIRAERAAQLVDQAISDTDDIKGWSRINRAMPHAIAALQYAPQTEARVETKLHLLNQIGHFLLIRGHYRDALPYFEQAVALGDEVHGPDYHGSSRRLDNLGKVLAEIGEFDKAEVSLWRAYENAKAYHGPHHSETRLHASNLATVLGMSEKYAEAETLHRQCLAIAEQYGEWTLDVSTDCNQLAIPLFRQQRYEEAEALVRRALEINVHVLGPGHPRVGISYMNHGTVLLKLGRPEEGEQLIRKSVDVLESAYDDAHPDTAGAYDSLADFLEETGRPAEACDYLRKALAIYERIYDPAHSKMTRIRSKIEALERGLETSGNGTTPTSDTGHEAVAVQKTAPARKSGWRRWFG